MGERAWETKRGRRVEWRRPRRKTRHAASATRFAGVVLVFARRFVHRSWRYAQVLLSGALLAPGRRTVRSVLRIRYAKAQPTFSDALAAVRRAIWREQGLAISARVGHRRKRRLSLPEPWVHVLCRAA